MGLMDRFRSGEGKDRETASAADRDWVRAVLEQFPRPRHPLTEDWEISVAALVRRVPRLPSIATKPLGLLDRIGAVHIGMRKVGFDGDEVNWDRVVELRTHDTIVILGDQLLDDEVRRWRALLPPIPGRGWVLDKISELLMTLMLAVSAVRPSDQAAIEALSPKQIPDEVSVSPAPAEEPPVRRVPAEIVYRGRLGARRVKKVSLSSMLLLQAIPSATATLTETAQEKGIAIVDVPATESDYATAAQRAEALANRLRAFRKRGAGSEEPDPSHDAVDAIGE